MTQEEKALREELIFQLEKGHAHMPFADAVADFPPELINTKAPNVEYTFWHLIEHIRLTQKDILDFIVAKEYTEPTWPDDYWPPKDKQATEKQWQKSITMFLDDQKKLVEIIRDPKTNLYAKIPRGTGQTITREIMVVVDHNAYHTGELGILRQVCKGWKK